ncbi:GNAT family N-acetyltransferase [Desertibaculum subflavum]|uniref:GNAT family N-acetyltransferase n=1 Tax=Desertibaculum subflavum TaxID=2268458 RepID=UPI0034D2DAED
MLLERFGGLGGRLPVLHGRRVVLRQPRYGDYEAWARLRASSRAFLEPWEPPWPADALDRGAFRRRVRRAVGDVRTGTGYSFLVLNADESALLGGIALSDIRRGIAQSADVGYWIGMPHARQGYMAESLQVVVDFAFDELRLHRIAAACLPDNDASRGVLAKAAFRAEGLARGYLNINGSFADHALYGILATDLRPWRLNGRAHARNINAGFTPAT